MSKISSEVPALISAVLEYKKFRQLACYSIECVTKVISPINRDYKKNLQIAFSASAPKCVVEVLREHIGKEDCLLVCVDCLHKLAEDDDNAEAIAREGGIKAVLASIGAIPTITEDALCEAMAILDTLCNHKRALEILADAENVGAVIDLVKKKTASSKVKVNCMRALDKLTRLPKGVESFMQCNGIPELLALISDYKAKCESSEFDEIDLETLTIATKILLRLCKQSSAVVDDLLAANGAEVYVGVLGSLTDLPLGHLQDLETGAALDTKDCLFSRLAGKLISNMYTGRISELVKSLKNSSQLNEFTLNLLGSLAMDAASSQGIVSNGGIEILLLGCCGANSSTKVLEVSTRAMARLAGNVSNLMGLVEQGAIEGLIAALIASQGSLASAADAILGLTLICSTGEYVDRVCAAGGLSAVLTCLTGVANSADGDELIKKEIIMAGLSFLEQIAYASIEGGEDQTPLILSMSTHDIWAILSIIQKYHSDVPLVTKAIRVIRAYVAANPSHGLLDNDGTHVAVIPLLVELLSEHAMFNESENVTASDSAVSLVDEVLYFSCSLLLLTGSSEGTSTKNRRESVRASQARVVEQQRVLHSTAAWKDAANEFVSKGDGVVNLAMLGYLERTTSQSSIESMDTFKVYSSISLSRCCPLITLFADGGAKGNYPPIPALAALISAFANDWSAEAVDLSTIGESLAAVHSAVVSLGLFVGVEAGHGALSMLASERVIEKLFFLLYALMNSPVTVRAMDTENSPLVGALVAATCLSSVHIIGALHSLMYVPGDVSAEESFIQLLGDPLAAAQLCIDVLQSSMMSTMSSSLQSLRLLWILNNISSEVITTHLVDIGGIEALCAILKSTGPMAATAANSVQADIGFRTVVTVVHIVSHLFNGISMLSGATDGARELSRRGGVKACVSHFIDPIGAAMLKDKSAAPSGDHSGESTVSGAAAANNKEDDRTIRYSFQCADAALLYLYALERIALLGEDECAILSKLGCVMLLFRLCDRFEDNIEIFNTTNRIVQLLVTQTDMLSILNNIQSKYSPPTTVTGQFGAKCSSDAMERAIREVERLCHFMGLQSMVEVFIENGGIDVMQSCISNAIAAIATARAASGSLELIQLRGNFMNACVRVLCRAAATGLLDGATDITVQLVCKHLLEILKKANEDSTSVDSDTLVETLQSIVRLANSLPAAASDFYSGGAVGHLVKRLQLSCADATGGGKVESQCMELSISALYSISNSCPYTYDYLLSTSKLLKQICVCITDYVAETGGVSLAPWVTMAVAFLSKIFNVLHECAGADDEATCGRGDVPSVALLLQVLRTAGSDMYSVLLNCKGNQLSGTVKPSTYTMDTLAHILTASLNASVYLTEDDKAAIGSSYGDGDLSTATCFTICSSLLTTEVAVIPKCTQLMRRVWLSSSGVTMQDTQKKNDLEAQMKSFLGLLRAFGGVSGGRYASLNATRCSEARKMLNQSGVHKLLISMLSGALDFSDALRNDIEATLSLLSDEDYGENALQTFSDYLTSLAGSVTAEGYLECVNNRIKGSATELAEGEEDAETTVSAIQNTLKLLHRYLQRGTQLSEENVSTLTKAAQFVSRRLYELGSHIDSTGYSNAGLSRTDLSQLSAYHNSVLTAAVQTLGVLQKLLNNNFSSMSPEMLTPLFDFKSTLTLANDVISWYVKALEDQIDAKSAPSGKATFKADVSDLLRACCSATSSIVQLCGGVDNSKRASVCESIVKSGLAESLHKISSLNTACAGVAYGSSNTSGFLSDMKAYAVAALDSLHDVLLANAEIIVPLYPAYETQLNLCWRMCDVSHITVQTVQAQRRTGCVSWVHVACGTEALVDSLLGLVHIMQNKLGVGAYCADNASSLYFLDLSGAIAYILHAIAEYCVQGVPMTAMLDSSVLDLIAGLMKADETLFDLLVHNATGPKASEASALELIKSQDTVTALVSALVAALKPPPPGAKWKISADRMKYNRTIALGALVKMVGLAAANPQGASAIPRALVDADIVNAIHEALSSPLVNTDEELVQSLMYTLCTLVELGYVDLADMPKDTRKMINHLLMQFPENQYLSSISSSMFQSLTEIFAKGPEAELENIYTRIITLQEKLGAVVEVRDAAQNKCYYYDGATGESSWAINENHMELLQELDTALRIIEGPLYGDLSNTSFGDTACSSFVALLNSHYSDVRVLGRLLKMVEYQMAVPVQRELYGVIDSAGAVPYDLLAYCKLDRAWDIAGSKSDPVLMTVTMMKDLSMIPPYAKHLSLREYIIFLNDFCVSTTHAAEAGTEKYLLKSLMTLVNLCQQNIDVVLICCEIDVPGTISSVVSSPWIGSELQKSIQVVAKTDATSTTAGEGYVFDEIIQVSVQLATALISGSNERRLTVCVATGAGFSTVLGYLSIEISAPTQQSGQKANTGATVSNTSLLSTVLRVLGVFSSSEACAWFMLHRLSCVGLLKARVTKGNMHSTDIIILCLNILANLASVEVTDGNAAVGYDTSEPPPIASVLLADQGGFDLCVAAMKRYPRNVNVIAAAAAVLLNACPEHSFDEEGGHEAVSEDTQKVVYYLGTLKVCEILVKVLGFCVNDGDTRSSDASSACSTSYIIIQLLSMLSAFEELFNELSTGELCSELVQIIFEILTAESASRLELERSGEGTADICDESVFFAAVIFLLQLVRSSQECLNTVYMCSCGLVDVLLELLRTTLSSAAMVQSILSLLGIFAGMSETISKEVAESGMSAFMTIVSSRLTPGSIDETDSEIVSSVFAVITVLVGTESNIRPLIRCGGFELLIRSLGVYMSDSNVMMAAVVALDLIAAAEDEYLMVFLQKGGIIAVKKVLDNQEPGTEVHEAASSLHLALSARERLLMASGSKTSRGALLARLKDGLTDVDAMMHEEEVTATKVELVDPEELKKHRNLLKAGQIVVDYSPPTNINGSGGGVAIKRHIQLASDFETLVMKDIVKKSVKGGRRVPLRNLRVVTPGLGPGHYQRMLTGKLKPVSKPEFSFYITSIKPEDAIYIECQSVADRDRWVVGMSSCLIAYRHQFVELREIMSG